MTKEDKRILKQFLQYKIPKDYMQLDISNCHPRTEGEAFDLMVCYEELFDYAWCAVHGKVVDSQHSFMNTPSAALTHGFMDHLRQICQIRPDIQAFCDLCIQLISILRKLDIHASMSDD